MSTLLPLLRPTRRLILISERLHSLRLPRTRPTHRPPPSLRSRPFPSPLIRRAVSRRTYLQPPLALIVAGVPLSPISANVDQRRVTRTTSSGRKTLSFFSAANVVRIVIWRRAPETQATLTGLLQPRSNVRPIYRKRSANSGSVSHQRNVSIGRTSLRKRRCAPFVHPPVPFLQFILRVTAERARGHVPQLRVPPSARQG